MQLRQPRLVVQGLAEFGRQPPACDPKNGKADLIKPTFNLLGKQADHDLSGDQ
ncbi:hypothetical protein [Nocardia sp. XZ_19_369]|uniref:hypothetical protein n=1 Tax=Nocardia sp. XZ_19_369 TaxID=2769487 RepID=UPI001E4AEC8B|nr:hypothetical protein [Nocardia sp. XZ_19_369]